MDDLQLTKKAEAYIAAASQNAQPEIGRFDGALYLIMADNDRRAIATSIERLIDMLDAMSPDPDLEDGADDEPSLGWGYRGGQSFPSGIAPNLPPGDSYDLELDNSDDEDAGDSEPTMGAIERHPTSRESPWGRCGELTVMRYGSNSQEDWAGSRATAPGRDECEAENEHGGDVLDEPHDRQADEPSLGWTNHIDQRVCMKVDETAWIEDGEQDGGDMRELDDEREQDATDYDFPGFISGGQGL
ncbi:hypothetical protein [Mesorhizobium qingshengii]|uniref:Uncharacterized protein n=1 Tax=Mesorhizobium qingshengii TaxID=1165689 RepID=A0A1G5V3J6_9HYPH|nr:hypothetical protein [Mesorhizobium qingshengii]SDA40432.1 hypothetical protein SAMN02927914_00238 [Mesorhizobium qingshengii]